ncbi:nucleoside hydrolase [Flammeovirgaceae bacterium SG7u.111]|nr:nucleoside hydrolase [Flammeovirgaceae bacterium SG7u.132]WPO38610.1 nucleoside hydrolase [Flammeovirgaceae bacterium SG7u.111]
MKKLVFMDHDGGIDDLLSLLLLLTIDEIELIGVSITPADCYLEPGVESSYKLLQLMGKEKDVPLGRGEYHGVNAFPPAWRAQPEVVNFLPMLINLPPSPDPYGIPNAVDLMVEKIKNASQPVSVLMTGPCSNLVLALEKDPSIKENIAEVVWMGGAFEVGGNVQTFQHNGSAEWNVFWDPINAKKMLAYELPLVFIPLDVTNHVPVGKTFLSRLAKQAEYKLSDLTGQFWATTIDTIPSYHYTYYMWDILATSYLALKDKFEVAEAMVDISVRPPNEGQTLLTSSGYKAKYAFDVDQEAFYEYMLQQFKR